jgi:cytochrome c biogenesis protein CcmG/thiol:disulfide interchange protein DsbE
MKNSRQLLFIIPLVLFFLLLVFLWKGLGTNTKYVPMALVDKTVPNFVGVNLLTGKDQSSTALLKGHVSILNVWATWCVPCLQEHNDLMAIKQHYPIMIYGLNYKDNADEARKWLAEKSNPYIDVLQDPTGKIGIDLGITGVPETFIIDKNGKIRFKHAGPLTMKIFQQQFMPIITALTAEN